VTTSAGSGTCTGCFTYVATTAAWCGANLDFNSAALPSGWSVSLIRSGPGLANGRLEADPVDAGAWLLAPGAPTAGTTQVTVEFDANLVQIYWGMGPQVAFETGSTFFAASSGTATYNFGLNKVTFGWQRGYSPVENQTQPGSVIRIDTLPFTYGTYHHRIDVTNAGSAYAITTSGGQFVARSSVGPVSGFSIGAITRFGLGVYTTSDASFWVDNLRISCQTTQTAPTVALVSPNSGPLAGGTSVTLTGTNFMAGAVVTIGGNALTNVTVVSSTSITGTTPAGTVGAKDVVVTTIAGSGTCTGCFSYVAPPAVPTVTSVIPNSGVLAGGTSVTLTGTNFVAGATATIGGTAVTNVTVVSSTSITGATPAGTAGAKNVVVTTSAGSGTCTGCFTYTTAALPTFAMTSANYRETDDLPGAVARELGSSYRMADWNDLVSYSGTMESFLNGLGIATGELVLLTYNGLRFDGGTRHYFLARGTAHAGAMVYDQFGSSAWLGSWYGYSGLRVMARLR